MPGSISILSYNLFMRPNPPFANDQARRVRFLPAVLTQFDVCVLEEIFDNPSRQKLISLVKDEFPHRTRITGRATGTRSNGGVVIFSKFPIVKMGVKLFGDESIGADSKANKGVRYACVRKQGRRYHIFGTHLQAGGQPNRVRVRKNQIAMLKRFIDSRAIPATQPVLIAGDMNVPLRVGGTRSEQFKHMLATLDAKMPTHVGPVASTPEGRRLDYVLTSKAHAAPTSGSTRSRRFTYDDKDLSDHFAIDSRWTFA